MVIHRERERESLKFVRREKKRKKKRPRKKQGKGEEDGAGREEGGKGRVAVDKEMEIVERM